MGAYGPPAAHEVARLTFYEWFWGQTGEPIDSNCWEWLGTTYPHGYGLVHHPEHGTQAAHRVAWMLSRGRDIPPGFYVLHHCDNRRCVRPTHLYLGTPAENAEDRDRYRGKSVAVRRAIRTRQRRTLRRALARAGL